MHDSAPTPRSASARPTWPASGTRPGHRPGGLLARSPADGHAGPPAAAAVPPAHERPATRRRGEHAPARPAQHRPPLRPVQRPVRGIPRRDAELLLAHVRPGDDLGCRAASQDRPPARLGAGRARTRVLEIGTGWGELAIRAARRGAQVTTVTLSQRAARPGAATGRGGGRHRPGRRPAGATTARSPARYDAIVSVEMIEAVGHALLADALLQRWTGCCTRGPDRPANDHDAHDRMLATQGSYTWIHKYIFPGGHHPLASRPSNDTAGRTRTSPSLIDRFDLRPTLRHDLAMLAGAVRRQLAESIDRAWVRPHLQAACGSSTSPTARPGSAPATSTSTSSRWPAQVTTSQRLAVRRDVRS